MMKYINNNKGSTLLMVLIVMVSLTVLGVTLLMMITMSTSMKYNDTRIKKSFYYGESGIDQVYGIIADEVDQALIAATDSTAIRMKLIEKEALKTFEDADTTNDGIYDSVMYYQEDAVTGDIEPIVATLQSEANSYFKEQFKLEFNTNINGVGNFNILLHNNITIKPPTPANNHGQMVNVTVLSVKNFNDDSGGTEDVDEFIFRNVKSILSYTATNVLTEKEITTNIVVKAPDMTYPMAIFNDQLVIVDNPIWQNALIAGRDINIDDQTTVNGDIYAYGYYPHFVGSNSKADRLDTSNFGGINIKDDLTVNDGNMISAAHIKTTTTNGDLVADDVKVYCGSFLTQKNANTSTLKLINGSDLYTYGDVELTAAESEIYIDGGYFGFGAGDGVLGHDANSCIVINSIDETKLTINGSDEDIVIMGTAYADYSAAPDQNLPPDPTAVYSGSSLLWPYQTGESISIRTNFMTYAINDGSNPQMYKVLGNSGLSLWVAVADNSGNEFERTEKIDYFKSAYPHNPHINIGKQDDGDQLLNLPQGKIAYTLGSYIYNSGASSGIDSTNIITGPDASLKATNMLNDFLTCLYTTEEYDHSATPSPAIPFGDFNVKNPFMGSYDPYDIVYNCISFSGSGVIVEETMAVKADWSDANQKALQVVYVTNKEEDLVIAGQGGSGTLLITSDKEIKLDDYMDVDNRMQGIIITKGNITINGALDYKGVIIAGAIKNSDTALLNNEGITANVISAGDINIEGTGDKTFTNVDDSYVTVELAKLISKNPDLIDIFDDYYTAVLNSSTPKVKTFDLGSTLVTPDEHNLSDRYAELIKLNSWKVE